MNLQQLLTEAQSYSQGNKNILNQLLAWSSSILDGLFCFILYNLTWPQVSDLNGWNNKAAKLYAITGVPQNFLIDPTGKIVVRNLKAEELHEYLDTNLPK